MELDTALDDLDGLLEASRVLADDTRKSVLRRNAEALSALRHELAAAADAYAATLISSAKGDLDGKRIRKCRQHAQARMPLAWARQKELAALVAQQRWASPALRDDLRQLVTLSLQCRSAIAALAPTVDRRAAEAIANKVLVELHDAVLLYLARARDAGDGETTRPRAAVVSHLERTERHAAELLTLGPESRGDAGSLGFALTTDTVGLLHRTALAWAQPTQNS